MKGGGRAVPGMRHSPGVMNPQGLRRLRKVGKATQADLNLLGITTVEQLAVQDADDLYVELCLLTGKRHDACAHDVFAAAIHEAKTGEPVNWWACTPARRKRQADGTFPEVRPDGKVVRDGDHVS